MFITRSVGGRGRYAMCESRVVCDRCGAKGPLRSASRQVVKGLAESAARAAGFTSFPRSGGRENEHRCPKCAAMPIKPAVAP